MSNISAGKGRGGESNQRGQHEAEPVNCIMRIEASEAEYGHYVWQCRGGGVRVKSGTY